MIYGAFVAIFAVVWGVIALIAIFRGNKKEP